MTLYAGSIKNWRLGAAWDNVLASQYFTKHTDSTLFRTGSLLHVQQGVVKVFLELSNKNCDHGSHIPEVQLGEVSRLKLRV